jgi:hypothetical protein
MSQDTAFKMKISLAFILRNLEDQSLHYFSSSRNNQLLFNDPVFIGNLEDLHNFAEKIEALDLLNHVSYPNSKYTFVRITNVTFFLTKVSRQPIGSAVEFPEYLKNNKGLISLTVNAKTGHPYQDNLCLFRCLALFRGIKIGALERPAKALLREYLENKRLPTSDFVGVSLNELEDISRIFDIGIIVYSLNEDGLSKLVFRTLKEDNIMFLNLYREHFSYIKDLRKYTRSYRCLTCNKIFNRSFNQRQHSKTCDSATRDLFSGGFFEPNRTIFDKLRDLDIQVPSELHYFPYRIGFDIECALIRETGLENTAKVDYCAKHLLASISVCSNVPGHQEPTCLITTGCEKDLVKRFLAYVTEISDTSHELMRERFSEYLEVINQIDDEVIVDKFAEYLRQIPLLSFCGQRYDIPVMKAQLFELLLDCEEITYVIKKGTTYSSISTENFLFLDVSNYLAVGTSYDQFVRAYGANVHKTYFPYEYFDSLDKLTSDVFPPYESFHSTLKNKNTLEPSPKEGLTNEERDVANRFQRSDDNTSLSQAQIVGVGLHRYEVLRQMFYSNGWTFADFLAHYNNRY